MGLLQEAFRRHGPAYLERFGAAMPSAHRKVLAALMACRSPDNGRVLYQCEGCDQLHFTARSCGNRHCATCQQHKGYAWLARELARRLPTHYFMLTFTVPAQLRPFLRAHQRVGYSALFAASAGAIKALAADRLGADTPGFFGVLHTWGRTLAYHPHIHYVASGGAFDSDSRRWHASSNGFYLPVHALSIIYRAQFRDAMQQARLLDAVPAEVWNIAWNVDCKAVGDAQASLRYLARYVFKVAISDQRIVSVDEHTVCLRYRKVGAHRVRTLRLSALEFIRRFLQHVLPKGLMKVRHYGFLSPSFAMPIAEAKARVEMAHGFSVCASPAPVDTPLPPCCRHCGGRLRYRALVPAPRARVTNTNAAQPLNPAGSG